MPLEQSGGLMSERNTGYTLALKTQCQDLVKVLI